VTPAFSVEFARTPGVSAADYEPAIVRLTPAQNTCRIVGATEGKEDARSSPAADWQVYSKFLEERFSALAKESANLQRRYSSSSGAQQLQIKHRALEIHRQLLKIEQDASLRITK